MLLFCIVLLDARGRRREKQGLYYEDQENNMPNIAAVLKEEISRLARREIRRQMRSLRRASAQYRKDIAEMKRRVSDLQRKAALLERQAIKDVSPQAVRMDTGRVRFTAKGLRSQRERLKFSAADYGKLIGVTDQTIYNWEHETARPRKQQLGLIASLRQIGRKQALARLKQLAGRGSKKS